MISLLLTTGPWDSDEGDANSVLVSKSAWTQMYVYVFLRLCKHRGRAAAPVCWLTDSLLVNEQLSAIIIHEPVTHLIFQNNTPLTPPSCSSTAETQTYTKPNSFYSDHSMLWCKRVKGVSEGWIHILILIEAIIFTSIALYVTKCEKCHINKDWFDLIENFSILIHAVHDQRLVSSQKKKW